MSVGVCAVSKFGLDGWVMDDEEDGKKPFVDSSTPWTDHEPFELLMTLVFETWICTKHIHIVQAYL